METPEIIVELFNTELSDLLSLIGSYYTLEQDTYRAKTFVEAGDSVRKYQYPILSGNQAKRNIKGIGKSVAEVIDEFLANSRNYEEQLLIDPEYSEMKKVKRLIDLEVKFATQKSIIDNFMRLYAVGPVKAVEFYNLGFRTYEDLLDKADLDDAQRTGLEWYSEISQRILRDEVTIIKDIISEAFDPYGIKWDITGSYRREENTTGDIDILIQNQDDLNLEGVIYLLRQTGIMAADLALGTKVYRGIIKLPENTYEGYENTIGHRLDIKMVNSSSYSYALLHFTGSQNFNVLCRKKAISMGLKLNEYGLFSNDEKTSYQASDEKEIFKYLKIKYLPPNERYRNLTKLPNLLGVAVMYKI
jgi:DNA polymerase/3'-5' exonuclease PolX